MPPNLVAPPVFEGARRGDVGRDSLEVEVHQHVVRSEQVRRRSLASRTSTSRRACAFRARNAQSVATDRAACASSMNMRRASAGSMAAKLTCRPLLRTRPYSDTVSRRHYHAALRHPVRVAVGAANEVRARRLDPGRLDLATVRAYRRWVSTRLAATISAAAVSRVACPGRSRSAHRARRHRSGSRRARRSRPGTRQDRLVQHARRWRHVVAPACPGRRDSASCSCRSCHSRTRRVDRKFCLHQRRSVRWPAAACSLATRQRFRIATKSERSSANWA